MFPREHFTISQEVVLPSLARRRGSCLDVVASDRTAPASRQQPGLTTLAPSNKLKRFSRLQGPHMPGGVQTSSNVAMIKVKRSEERREGKSVDLGGGGMIKKKKCKGE